MTATALILVDVQNDFMPPDGSLAVSGGECVPAKCNELRRLAQWRLVALTQDWHPRGHSSFASTHGRECFTSVTLSNGREQMLWPDHCVQESRGAEFHSSLERAETDVVVRKGMGEADSYSGFCDNDGITKTELEQLLNQAGVTRVIVAGLAFDYCVGFTALDARKAGLDVAVVTDAAASVATDSERGMLARLRDAGVVLTTLAELKQLPSPEHLFLTVSSESN
ncbi:MAG: hypothetical protein MHM6MM_003928 [Cercozoa sp. M6MM]